MNQHGGGGVGADQPGLEEPHMYQAASGLVPFVPTSTTGASGQVADNPYKVEQQWTESSQSDASPPYLTSPPQLQQQPSSNLASSSRSDLGNPSEGGSSSQPSHPPQRIWGGGLVAPEKSGLPGLPPGASPPIPGGMGSMLMGGGLMTPDTASMYHPARSPPPQYEG
ncbi:hypothetical protein FRB95_008686 [Tulasnella sp. JGI-2019a]|nr:hypothetical protein FRB95_008686 [Tulasnella sp. JGI-2019a]